MESTLKNNKGIYEFNSLEELINNYINILINNSNYKYSEVEVYYFDKVRFGCDFYDYVHNIKSNKNNLVLKKKIKKEEII